MNLSKNSEVIFKNLQTIVWWLQEQGIHNKPVKIRAHPSLGYEFSEIMFQMGGSKPDTVWGYPLEYSILVDGIEIILE